MKKNITNFKWSYLLLAGALWLGHIQVNAQDPTLEWAKSIETSDNSYGRSIAVDPTGNVYIVGEFQGTADFNPSLSDTVALTSTGRDGFLTKYDASGNYIWGIGSTGAGGGASFNDLALDPSGNVFVTGYFYGTVDFDPGPGTALLTSAGSDMFLAKYAANGTYISAVKMGGNTVGDYSDARRLVLDSEDGQGAVYITGFFSGTIDFDPGAAIANITASGEQDAYVAKYTENLDYVWAISMGGSGSTARALDVAVDAAKNVYVTGGYAGSVDFDPGPGSAIFTTTFINPTDFFLAKYDSAGNYVWAHGIEGVESNDRGIGIALDAAANVHVIGHFVGAMDFDPGPGVALLASAGFMDVFFAKYDSSGNYIWAKNIGGPWNEFGGSIDVDALGNVYVTGTIEDGTDFDPGPGQVIFPASGDVTFLGKYDADGNYIWASTMGATMQGISHDPAYQTVVASTSGIWLTGAFNNALADFDPGPGTVTLPKLGNHNAFFLKMGQCETNSITLSETACDSFPFGDTVYTATGTYTHTFTNAGGCDSIITLDVIISPSFSATVTKNDATLTAVNNADAYQWINCDGNAIIPGAINQDFTATQTGSYAVIVTSGGGCNDTSDCVSVEVPTGINELVKGNKVQLYPNPADDQVTIQTQQALKDANIRLVNIIGQSLVEQTNQYGTFFSLDVSRYASGVYFVEVSEGGKTVRIKVVKD